MDKAEFEANYQISYRLAATVGVLSGIVSGIFSTALVNSVNITEIWVWRLILLIVSVILVIFLYMNFQGMKRAFSYLFNKD